MPQCAALLSFESKFLKLPHNAALYGTMAQKKKAPANQPPKGGRRNHSRFAHLYLEVCRLRAKRLTWQEITDLLGKKEGVTIERTALWRMWRNRQTGAVPHEFVSDSEQSSAGLSDLNQPASLRESPKPETEQSWLEESPETPASRVVLKVRGKR